MNNKRATQLSAVVLSALLIGDVTSSLVPKTYAETNGYQCYAVTVATPTISDVCVATPATIVPIACFPEQRNVNLPVYYHGSLGFLSGPTGPIPVPYRDLTTFNQDTTLLPTPLTTFTPQNTFQNAPMPISHNLDSVSNGAHNSVSLLSGTTYQITPDIGYFGGDILPYTTIDGNGNNHTGKIIVKNTSGLNGADNAALPLAKNILRNSGITTIRLPLSTAYTPTLVTPPVHGTISVSTTSSFIDFNYKPNPNYTGEDTFSYTITDGTNTSSPTTGLINVYDPATRPIAPYIGSIIDVANANYSLLVNIDQDRDTYTGVMEPGPELNKVDFTTPVVASGSLNIPIDINTTFETFYYGKDNYYTNTIVRVDHVSNATPVLSNMVTTQPTPNSLAVSVDVADPDSNQGALTIQLSQDNFNTFQSYPLYTGTLNGTHTTTIQNINNGTYSSRVMAAETNAPDVCLDVGGSGIDPNKRTFSPIRSFSVTTTNSTSQSQNSPSVLIRTGGHD
jgi:Bacterial Ig domain